MINDLVHIEKIGTGKEAGYKRTWSSSRETAAVFGRRVISPTEGAAPVIHPESTLSDFLSFLEFTYFGECDVAMNCWCSEMIGVMEIEFPREKL